MNLVKQIKEIHTYTSERFIKSILLLTKKIGKKLKIIENWNAASLSTTTNQAGSLSSLNPMASISSESLSEFARESYYYAPSLDDHENMLLLNSNQSSPTQSPVKGESTNTRSSSTTHNERAYANIQMIYSELALYKVAITHLFQFTTVLLQTRLSENIHFLYAIILHQERLLPILMNPIVDNFLNDRISASNSSSNKEMLQQDHTNHNVQSIDFNHYILWQSNYYLNKLEKVRLQKNILYFTAQEV